MDLIQLVVLILVVGLIVGLIQYLPIPPPFKQVAMAIVVLIVILWLLGAVGPMHPLVIR